MRRIWEVPLCTLTYLDQHMVSFIVSTWKLLLRNIAVINDCAIITTLFILSRHDIHLWVTNITTNVLVLDTAVIVFTHLGLKIWFKVILETFVIYSIIFELQTTSACNYVGIEWLEDTILISHFANFKFWTASFDVDRLTFY